jgi:hypothetical protein
MDPKKKPPVVAKGKKKGVKKAKKKAIKPESKSPTKKQVLAKKDDFKLMTLDEIEALFEDKN